MGSDTRGIINELREKVEASIDGGTYGNRSKALNDIDSFLKSKSIDDVKSLLLPTANLQELAMENGWGDEFNELASKLEKVLGDYSDG